MPEFLSQAQGALPAAADNVTATSGSAGVYGAWAEVAASAPSDLAVTGVTTSPGGFSPNTYATWNVGHGAAGSEVSLAEFGGYIRMSSGTWSPDPSGNVIPAMIPVKTVTSGTRIAVRLMRGDASNTATCAVLYAAVPLGGDMETTTSPLRTTASVVNATAGGSAWTSGSYAEMAASTAAAWVVNHFVASGSGTSSYFELGLGTGAAGAETEITAYPSYNENSGGSHGHPKADALGILLDNIAASTRVACRLRATTASITLALRIGYYEKPL